MAQRNHRYTTRVTWTGNRGDGTASYRAYARDHTIAAGAKADIAGSSDPAFRGDAARWNPEELVLAALSACHQLWYLHLCADAGIRVLSYEDDAEGVVEERADGGGGFTQATLRPRIAVARGADLVKAHTLHERAHALCAIANSVNFPVAHEAVITEAD